MVGESGLDVKHNKHFPDSQAAVHIIEVVAVVVKRKHFQEAAV